MIFGKKIYLVQETFGQENFQVNQIFAQEKVFCKKKLVQKCADQQNFGRLNPERSGEGAPPKKVGLK